MAFDLPSITRLGQRQRIFSRIRPPFHKDTDTFRSLLSLIPDKKDLGFLNRGLLLL